MHASRVEEELRLQTTVLPDLGSFNECAMKVAYTKAEVQI
jgi:hypothetical protein